MGNQKPAYKTLRYEDLLNLAEDIDQSFQIRTTTDKFHDEKFIKIRFTDLEPTKPTPEATISFLKIVRDTILIHRPPIEVVEVNNLYNKDGEPVLINDRNTLSIHRWLFSFSLVQWNPPNTFETLWGFALGSWKTLLFKGIPREDFERKNYPKIAHLIDSIIRTARGFPRKRNATGGTVFYASRETLLKLKKERVKKSI